MASCYRNSLQIAVDHGIRTIAFPSISTGVFHYPVRLAAQIAVKTVREFIAGHPDVLDVVMWVLFDEHTEAVCQAEVER